MEPGPTGQYQWLADIREQKIWPTKISPKNWFNHANCKTISYDLRKIV
jgi:hypothetical protein